ncbi:MAG: hypothetical protein ACFCD0_17725 [Gemmataceae bacterium]
MKKHRLVVIGDSLSQGFMSGAIYRTDISYPVMIAEALGVLNEFIVPDFSGEGGLPLNLELILGELSDRYGERINWWEYATMLTVLQSRMDRTEDYWERGKGSKPYPQRAIHHNLSVWGFEVRDAYTVTEGVCRRQIPNATDDWFKQVPEMPMYRTARRVLNPPFADDVMEFHQIKCAKQLAEEGGIENLIVFLGANNALGTVTSLSIRHSSPDDLHKMPHERTCNLYLPAHFKTIYEELADHVEQIGADNVFVATIPHVTIPPVTRGVSKGRRRLQGGYFEYYTRPWVWDENFDPEKHPHLTREEAKQIDHFIDEYNKVVKETAQSRNWHVCDLAKTLDDLAYRRNQDAPSYQFPQGLRDALKNNSNLKYLVNQEKVTLDSRFFTTQNKHPDKIAEGGLFSLDGIHPTTIGYGIIAHEFITVMEAKGVTFPKKLAWDDIVKADTLINNPPKMMASLRDTLSFLDKRGLLSSILTQFH